MILVLFQNFIEAKFVPISYIIISSSFEWVLICNRYKIFHISLANNENKKHVYLKAIEKSTIYKIL